MVYFFTTFLWLWFLFPLEGGVLSDWRVDDEESWNNLLPVLHSSSLEFLLLYRLSNVSLKYGVFSKNRVCHRTQGTGIIRKANPIILGGNIKSIVMQLYLWRLNEPRREVRFNHLTGWSRLWIEISAYCLRTKIPPNQTANGLRRMRVDFLFY